MTATTTINDRRAEQQVFGWRERTGFWASIKDRPTDALNYLVFADAAAGAGAGLLEADLRRFADMLADGWTAVADAVGTGVFGVKIKAGRSVEVCRFSDHDGITEPRRFAVGDAAEFDSYNLSYYGAIQSITAKTITIVDSHYDNKVRRLKPQQFAWRNYDFNAAETARRNSEEMMHL